MEKKIYRLNSSSAVSELYLKDLVGTVYAMTQRKKSVENNKVKGSFCYINNTSCFLTRIKESSAIIYVTKLNSCKLIAR